MIPVSPQVPPFDVEWYSKGDRAWRSDVLPTRGEFLIRKGGRVRPRRVAAVLELEKPYLAVLKCESRPTRHGADGAGLLSAAAQRHRYASSSSREARGD